MEDGNIMDNFHEQLVTTGKMGIYKFVNVLMYIFFGLTLILLGSANIIPAIVLIVITLGMFLYKGKLFVEYEYAFTNGEIDVDKIIGMRKRTRILTFNIKDIEVLAEENSDFIRDFSTATLKEINAIPRKFNHSAYIAMITGRGQKIQLRFSPDEEFLALCFRYNPRAVKK
jgi:hypothetical protein